MQADGEHRYWVRIYLPSREELMNTQNMDGVELFSATMRVIDHHNLVIDGYLPEKIYTKLRKHYRIRLLGDVEQEIGKAVTYVSKTNRYRKE